jgi:hypothetical protein
MIATIDDILEYLDRHLEALGLYGHSRYQAAMSAISFIQSNFSTLEVLAPSANDGAVHRALRESQDVLKYALYGVFTSCPAASSSKATPVFGPLHFETFRSYSVIHDCVQGIRHGIMDYTVDAAARKITFLTSGSSLIDGRRGRKELDERHETANRAIGSFTAIERTEIRKAFGSHFRKVVVNTRSGQLEYEITGDTYRLALLTIARQEPFFLRGPKLPGTLNLGPFSTEDYRSYWRTLAALTLIHDLSYKSFVDAKTIMPPSSSVLVAEDSCLENRIASLSTLPLDVVRDITHDLTYSPIEVDWTEPQYQPLLPVQPGRVAVPSLLVGNNNYERNYAALVEKLPWRKKQAALLKSVREDEMIDGLRGPIKELGLSTKPRVPLRHAGGQVSDIDLAIWQESTQTIILASLKWHYGPDSVTEVMNHAKRYQEANAQQRRILDFATAYPREVLTSLSLGTWDQPNFLPLIIYQEDMPLEKDREPGLPATNITRFIRVLRQKSGNLQACHAKLKSEYTSFPATRLMYTYSEYRLGEWRFDVPTSYADES